MTPDLFEYQPPAQRHSDTSQEAAEAIKPSAASLRMKVLDFIVARGSDGATDAEIQTALRMEGSTQRPRRVELVDAGLIRDSGCKRTTASLRRATVWVAA